MDKDASVGFYHCISRIVDRNFVLGDLEKEHFVKLMRAYEAFCGVRIITFCIMTNHFHILVEVPRRPVADQLPSDQQLIYLLKTAGCSYGAATLAQRLQNCHRSLQNVPPAVESKCTTPGRWFSRLGGLLLARTGCLVLRRYAAAACCCSP